MRLIRVILQVFAAPTNDVRKAITRAFAAVRRQNFRGIFHAFSAHVNPSRGW